MTIYADTSFLVAVKVRRDNFHKPALDYYEDSQDEFWLWSPWHRTELFHALRQYALATGGKRGMTLAEARTAIHRLEYDVLCGYFTHVEADWRDVLRTANELSAAHSFTLPFASADLLHVAYAKELAAELFVSFDDDQLSLAAASGMKTEKPSKR